MLFNTLLWATSPTVGIISIFFLSLLLLLRTCAYTVPPKKKCVFHFSHHVTFHYFAISFTFWSFFSSSVFSSCCCSNGTPTKWNTCRIEKVVRMRETSAWNVQGTKCNWLVCVYMRFARVCHLSIASELRLNAYNGPAEIHYTNKCVNEANEKDKYAYNFQFEIVLFSLIFECVSIDVVENTFR